MLVVSGACWALALLGLLMQFHPAGPTSVLGRVVLAATSLSSAAVGVRWMVGRWPDYRGAVGFVVWADAALAAAAVTMSQPEVRLLTLIYLSQIGVFAAFVLGPRVVHVHCVFGSVLIAAVVGQAMLAGGSVLVLWIYVVPAVAWVVMLPLGGLAIIDGGRRAIKRTARSANVDPLTTLLNRRGLEGAVRTTLRGCEPTAILVAAVCDVDRFKRLNDTHGHDTGDAALAALARDLQALAGPGDILSRIGGDELVLVTVVADRAEVDHVARRFERLTRCVLDDEVAFTVSVGVASAGVAEADLSFDDVLRDADRAMYDAKRVGGATVRSSG
jgi:diguanylate cyclase